MKTRGVTKSLDPNQKVKLYMKESRNIRLPPRKSTGGVAPRSDWAEKIVKESDLDLPFQELVSWCMKGDAKNLEKAINAEGQLVNAKPNHYSNQHEDSISYHKFILTRREEAADEFTKLSINEFATISGHVEIMKVLLKVYQEKTYYLINRYHRSCELKQCLKIAMVKNNFQMVKCLVEQYFKWDEKDDHGRGHSKFVDYGDCLRLACEIGKVEIVKLLIENHANPNQCRTVNYGYDEEEKNSTYGFKSPLRVAAEKGNDEIVEYLLQNGANVFQQDEKGRNPLELLGQDYKIEVPNLNKIPKRKIVGRRTNNENEVASRDLYNNEYLPYIKNYFILKNNLEKQPKFLCQK